VFVSIQSLHFLVLLLCFLQLLFNCIHSLLNYHFFPPRHVVVSMVSLLFFVFSSPSLSLTVESSIVSKFLLSFSTLFFFAFLLLLLMSLLLLVSIPVTVASWASTIFKFPFSFLATARYHGYCYRYQ